MCRRCFRENAKDIGFQKVRERKRERERNGAQSRRIWQRETHARAREGSARLLDGCFRPG